MTGWAWINLDVLITSHDMQLAEHGGTSGISGMGPLQLALARPRNLAAYGEPDAAALAASYAYGLAKNHAFVDGNKRIAFIAAATFLKLNGQRLVADQAQATLVMLSVASGAFSEDELAGWIRKHLRPVA